MMNEIASECTIPFEYEEQDDDFDCAADSFDINVTEEESAWTKATVGYLLEECLKKKKDLHDPRHRRNRFFNDIREQMLARGFVFSADTLQKKFHNLKKHFCTICQNRDRATVPASRPVTWPYYEKMMEIFAEELEIEDAPTMASLYPDPPLPKNSIVEESNVAKCDSTSESEAAEMEYIDDGDDDIVETTWTHESVIAFLRECNKRKYELWDPQIRRRQIFNDIRHRLRAKGFKFNPESLDRKLRNMKKHFQVITDSINRVGSSNKRRKGTWPYYNQLKQIYGEEMEKEMSLIKRAKSNKTATLLPQVQSILPPPTTTMKFRPIAPKIEPPADPEPPQQIHYMVSIPVASEIVNSTITNGVVEEEMYPTMPNKIEYDPPSPGDFDGIGPSHDVETSLPPSTYDEGKPISFEEKPHTVEKPRSYIGERLRFSLDILALEERRTVVAEKMAEEFRESNRIKQKRLEFNRIKLEYIKRKKKTPR